MATVAADQHPSWCHIALCTAMGARGVHRSQPASVDGLDVEARLYATATAPQDVFVEVRHLQQFLPAREARNLSRVLASLTKAAAAGC